MSTWRWIHEFARIRVCGKPTPTFVEHQFVHWLNDANEICYSPFTNGTEVDYDGVPLHPKPCRIRTLNREAMRAFNDAARQLRARVAARIVVGEFDDPSYGRPYSDRVALDMLFTLVQHTGYIPTDMLCGMFVQRPKATFGRPRAWQRPGREEPTPSAAVRLESNITAAKRAYVWQNRNEVYDETERSYA